MGFGPKKFDTGQVVSIFCCSGKVWKISPKNGKFFPFGSKSTRVKVRSASYLLQVKSMLGSGQGPSLAVTLAQSH